MRRSRTFDDRPALILAIRFSGSKSERFQIGFRSTLVGLRGRLIGGTSVNSPDRRLRRTEAVKEFWWTTTLEKAINDRQTLYDRWMFLPDIGDFGSFRFRIKAGWDLAINQEGTWKLSLSMFDRYDSTPSGTDRKNDLDYWASLSWSF